MTGITAPMFTELRVVTTAAWLARDLDAAGLLPVRHDLGLDLPSDTTGTAWWCPGSYAARLHISGVRTTFLGPDATFQARMPGWALGRPLHATTLDQLPMLPDGAFIKVADIKVSSVPARWWNHADEFTSSATAAGLPGDTPVLWTPAHLDLTEEHRCFITDGRVTAASVYLQGGQTWDAWETGRQPGSGHVLDFAQSVVSALTEQPDGWVLDVGVTGGGDQVVVEANPSWCANPYHCDPGGAVPSILAGQLPRADDRWAWCPGEFLATRVRRLPRRLG